MWWAILITTVITSFLTLVFINFRAGEKQICYQLTHRFSVADPQFLRCMGQLLGPGILPGNRITALHNGDQIFPAMLAAIRRARNTITFETYIYWSGEIGRQFSEAFCERACAGVKIHVIIDWAGSGKIDTSYVKDLKAAGVEVELYHPLHWYNLTRMNNRTHRKLLVVDGLIGFTGGVGIADQWLGRAETKDQWRDSHYQIVGPSVAQMQAAFTDNWIKARARVLFDVAYFPELQPEGDSLAQVFKSSVGGGSESVHLMYLLSIASAASSIRLQAAYFVPDDLAIATFVSARKRGVKIEIIVPGPDMNEKIAQHASRSLWGELLDAGVEIYEYEPTMYHCKVLIVDDVWVSVGSTNFDDRSFRLNDEANLNVYDATFAAEQVRVFEQDRDKSRLMTRAEFRNRSAVRKLCDSLAGVFRGNYRSDLIYTHQIHTQEKPTNSEPSMTYNNHHLATYRGEEKPIRRKPPRPTARAKDYDDLRPEAEPLQPTGHSVGEGMLSNQERLELSQIAERNKGFLNPILSVWPPHSA